MDDSVEPPQQLFTYIAFQFAPELIVGLPIMVVLLIFSGLISSSEVAFFSLTPADFKEAENQKSNQSALEKLKALLDKPKELLATILLANNFVNVAIIILSSFLLDASVDFGDNLVLAFAVQTVLITSIILLFGELMPKVYATRNRLQMAIAMTSAMQLLSTLLNPFSKLLVATTGFIDKRFKPSAEQVSVDQLSHALEIATNNETTAEEQKLFKGIVKFGNTDVKQVMTPRVDMVAIDFQSKYAELLETIMEHGFSRMPVYKESVDAIVGILYIKDLLPHLNKAQFGWQKLIRAPFFVPENKKIDDLLKEFQERKIHMAVVVDEYGGSSGIITMEDILEEIVGDISDEFDDEEVFYSKISETEFLFEGKVLLKDLYRALNIEGDNFEAHKGDADTLAGFILELSGKIPKTKDEIVFEQYTFTIEAADHKRISTVKVSIQPISTQEYED